MKFDDVDAAVAGTGFMTSAQGRKVYEFIVENNLGRVLELGFAHGKSTCYLAAAADELGGNAHVLTIDRTAAMARTPNIHQLLETCGLTERVTPVVAVTSYTWELMKILERDPQPRVRFRLYRWWPYLGRHRLRVPARRSSSRTRRVGLVRRPRLDSRGFALPSE